MNRQVRVIGWLWAVVWAGLGGTNEAQEAKPPGRRPQIWAIVVGIDNYTDPLIPDSRNAVRDASDVRNWFLRSGGWSRDHVLYLVDLGSRQPGLVGAPRPNILPIKDNLDWAFQKWLPSRAHPGDLVVFYYAGRVGTAVSAPDPIREPSTEYYLMPTDANQGNVTDTGWSLDRAMDRLVFDTHGRCQVACWLATTVGGVPPGIRPPVQPGGDPPPAVAPSGRDWLGRLARWPGVTAWLASDRPLENVIKDEPSTLFTKMLLNGLGTPPHKLSLAASLQAMQRDPDLKSRGFQTIGGVPPSLTLWSDLFGLAVAAPRPEMVLQVGHADMVSSFVASADGQRMITASMDSTIRVWSLKDRALLRVLTGHEVGTTALGLSADGRWLISGGGRPANAILIHDLNLEFRQSVLDQPHDQAVVQIAMLPDGDHFVSADRGGRSFLWDLKAAPPEPRPWLDKAAARPGKPVEPVNCLEVACGGSTEQGKVAALCDDRTVRIFNASGTGEAVQIRWPDQPSTLAIDPKGRWLAVGFDNDQLMVRDLATGVETTRKVPAGPISRLAFSSQGVLAVGHGKGLSLFPAPAGPPQADPTAKTLIDRRPSILAFSPDGVYLAVCSKDIGGLEVWHVGGDEPRSVLSDEEAGASALAFTGDSRLLLTGGFKGSVKTWSLQANLDDKSWSIPANRAKVQNLSASPSRQFLLMLNDLSQAQIWDLKERTCRRLAGSWTSGTFATKDDLLVLTEAAEEDRPGRLVSVRLDRDKVVVDPMFFRRATDGFQVPESSAFVGVTISPDGSRIAATTNPAQEPLVCVWETKSGRLTHWILPAKLKDPVRSLSFSSDARYLLTAGDSPEAKLWDLVEGQGEPKAPAVTFEDPDPQGRNVSAAVIRPGDSHQIVTGHRNGLVRLWNWREGHAAPIGPPIDLVQGLFAGEIKALAFAAVGGNQYLAAAGDGTSLWLSLMAEPRPMRIADLGVRPHHFEQINALIAWPIDPAGGGQAAATLISGSDDTMVKLWDLKDRALRLRGTFCAAVGRQDEEAPADPGATVDLDWVVYSADGHFDASAKGRELIRFRHSDQARALEQFDDTKLYTFDLGELLLAGKTSATVAKLDEPSPISIEPPSRIAPGRPDTQLAVLLGSPDLRDVRLYHNNVPVSGTLELPRDRERGQGKPLLSGRITAPVRLVKGPNRFYAMATMPDREGSFDSRSPELEVSYDGPMEPGKLHTLALGVGDYKRRRLKYADHDAERLSEVLHERGFHIAGKSTGMRIVRTNADVTIDGVNKAFRQLADAVKGRPQDTVVVFLAGHTGVFEDLQFCLLLPSFPFPADAPTVAQVRAAVVSRQGADAKADPRDVMPYSVIEANLMRLDALNRLVIVDACQAEAIFDDAQVNQIRKWMEIKSRKVRNAYLMAARRGDPALEVEGLRHGLFTYTLLRGMGGGAIDLEQEPKEISQLSLRENADFNGDGVITTGELDDYAKRTVPILAQLFPQLIARSREEELKRQPNLPAIQEGELEQHLRMQSTSASFPLVPLPAQR